MPPKKIEEHLRFLDARIEALDREASRYARQASICRIFTAVVFMMSVYPAYVIWSII